MRTYFKIGSGTLAAGLLTACAFVRPAAPANVTPEVLLAATPTTPHWIVAPTDTPAPTTTPIPDPLLEAGLDVRSATLDTLPSIRRDLVFVDTGALLRWNHVSGRIEPLLGRGVAGSANMTVTAIQAYPAQQRVLVKYREAGAPAAISVGLLDVPQLAFTPVFSFSVNDEPGLRNHGAVALSPDGTQLLAIVPGARQEVIVFGLRGERRVLSVCEPRVVESWTLPCEQPAWSADGAWVYWHGGEGLWRASLAQSALPEVIAPIKTTRSGRIMPFEMAPCAGLFGMQGLGADGNLMLVQLYGYEWSHQGLVDLAGGHCMQFDGSYRGHGPQRPQVWQWLPDGQLLATGPHTQVLRMRPNSSAGALALDVTGDIRFPKLNDQHVLQSFAAKDAVYLAMTTGQAGSADTRGVFRLDFDGNTARRAHALPLSVDQIGGGIPPELVWAPDGSGLIYRDARTNSDGSWRASITLYVPLDAPDAPQVLFNLAAVIPATAKDIAWLN